MSKSLFTRLEGSSNNPSILRLGELVMSSNLTTTDKAEDYILIGGDSENAVTVEMLDGYFRDSQQGSGNNGTKKEINLPYALYPSLGEHKISVMPKYDITQIRNVVMYIDDLKYSQNLNSLRLLKGSTGDLESLADKNKLTVLSLNECDITGDIASLAGLTNLTAFNVSGCKDITGDIASLKGLTKITSINLTFTNLSGNCESIKSIRISDAINLFKGNKIGGDISQLNTDGNFISFLSRTSKDVSWKTTRSSSEKILAIEGSPNFGDDLDAMLINQANCTKGFIDSDNQYKKEITVLGNRTSASDTAVASLKAKGYKVIVNNVEL